MVAGAYFYLDGLGFRRLGSRLGFLHFLACLVLVFPKFHYLGYRGITVGADLNQIQTFALGEFQSVSNAQNADVFVLGRIR